MRQKVESRTSLQYSCENERLRQTCSMIDKDWLLMDMGTPECLRRSFYSTLAFDKNVYIIGCGGCKNQILSFATLLVTCSLQKF